MQIQQLNSQEPLFQSVIGWKKKLVVRNEEEGSITHEAPG
jgi:hypothetical protein